MFELTQSALIYDCVHVVNSMFSTMLFIWNNFQITDDCWEFDSKVFLSAFNVSAQQKHCKKGNVIRKYIVNRSFKIYNNDGSYWKQEFSWPCHVIDSKLNNVSEG